MFSELFTHDRPSPRWVRLVSPWIDWTVIGLGLLAAAFGGLALGDWISGLI